MNNEFDSNAEAGALSSDGPEAVAVEARGVAPPGAGAILTGNEWDQRSASADFRRLVAAKARFIVPATIFFIVYYFALPVLVGFAPALMERQVVGVVNLAYLFALSQFFMAWVIAWLYVRQAAKWDRASADLLEKWNAAGRARRDASGGAG